MKKKIYKLCIILVILALTLAALVISFAAPTFENFDEAGLGDKGTQSYTLNGMIYTTNDTGGLNINIVNDGNIASGADYALGYRSSGFKSTTQVTFGTSDGSEFKLNNFVISTGIGDTTVTIKGYRDNSEVASSSVSTASYTTFNVSTNVNWENIDEVRMTGADLDIDIDDIDFSPAVSPTYSVTYDGNDNTSGSVPTDATSYHSGDIVTVIGNTGSLVKTDYTFDGWNTAANGSGTSYSAVDTFNMGSSNITLYAQWTENTYNFTYNGNDNTSGSVPTDATSYHSGDIATVMGNTGSLVRTGYTFNGWNTSVNGSGTSYSGGDTFNMGSNNVTLYAQWTAIDYTVTYNGNTNTGGAVPTNSSTYNIGDTVTVMGNTGSLVKTDYTFDGWNTAANGSGTSYSVGDTFNMGSSNITLYAQWTKNTYNFTYNGNDNTSGSVPTDATSYHSGDIATVMGNTGSLVRTGYTFNGWNTSVNGSGTSYSGGDTFNMGSNNVTLYAQYNVNQYNVTFESNGGSVIDPVTANFNSLITEPTAPIKTGYNFVGWYKDAGLTTEWKFGTDKIPASDITLYGKWNRISSGNSGGSSSNSNSESSDDEAESNEQENNTIVIVNGQEEKAGLESVTEVSGEKTVEVKLDSDVIDAIIEAVIGSQSQDIGETQSENIIEVPILTQDAKNVTIILTGDMVKKMDESNFKLSILSEAINYVIPSKEVGIESVAKNLGVAVENVKEIEMEVQINKVDEKVTNEIKAKAKAKDYEIVIPPMSFEVVAKTKTTSGEEKQLTVSKFNQYVQRMMKLPEGVDPSKITTGFVYNEDGTFSHVPTSVFMKDGAYYAKINSLTNSNYAAIWNPVVVESVENHWSKEAVNDMASRLIIKNPEMFIPNREITRGEFAEYITRALGIYRTGVANTQKFLDVGISHELADAIQIASDYGIISGYPDGSFKPSEKISREEAMVMYSRAMDIVGLAEANNDRIESYIDRDMVTRWAYNDVKKVLSAGVFNGKTKDTINPKDTLTCAESATAIRNLLMASGLIND